MNSWVVAALILNALLVAAAIVVAVHIASRSTAVAVKVELEWSRAGVTEVMADADATPRLPLFDAAQMRRTEWRALHDAFDAARVVYVRELVKARHSRPSLDGDACARAIHDFAVAKRRLTRFELEVIAGSGNGRS